MTCSPCEMARLAALAEVNPSWWSRNWMWVALGGAGLLAVLAVAAWKRSR